MEIDEIFNEIEEVKIEEKKQPTNKRKEDKPKEDSKYITNKDNRRYVDGLPIYTIEELNIGKGGDTPDCPFDCDCCY